MHISLNLNILIPLISSVLVFIWGLFLVIKLEKQPQEKNEVSILTDLVSEGLDEFSKRTTSIIAQIIIYIIIIFWGVTAFTHTTSVWKQVTAFGLGTMVMTLSTFITLKTVPKFIPKIIAKSGGYSQEAISYIFDISKAGGFIIFGSVISVMMIAYSFLGISSILGYGFGIMVTAFFLRIGGGVYKNAAKIASLLLPDRVKALPESHRNPSKILNIIGSYIGEMIGFSSDILSSYMFAIIACIVSTNSVSMVGRFTSTQLAPYISYPIYLVTAGLGIALLVYYFGKFRIRYRFQNLLLEGIYLSILLNGVAAYLISQYLGLELAAFWTYLIGSVGAVLIAFLTDYATHHNNNPTQKIAEESEYGPVIILLNGISSGLLSKSILIIVYTALILGAYKINGSYGLAIAAIGIVSASISIITSKIFSSISSNLYNILPLIPEGKITKNNVKKIYDLGATTISIGNGFSSAIAVFTTFSLLISLVSYTNLGKVVELIIDDSTLIGLVVGIMMTFSVSGTIFNGIKKTIINSLKESARQLRDIPYLLENKAYPDMIKASSMHTIHALKVLTFPGLILVLVPLFSALIVEDIKLLFGIVLGVLLMGAAQGYYWSNFGDTLANTKRFIEKGQYGGPDSKSHKAAVLAEAYASSFTEVLGPATNILIKAITIIAIIIIMTVK